MTDLTTTFRPVSETTVGASPAPIAETTAAEPALISEQQVLFSTAAAAAIPPAKTARRHYPKRSSYLETALMAREMDRL